MDKFIPFEKLSKKKKRELNAKRRGSWHGVNPVTRKPNSSRAYNRRKAGFWKTEVQEPAIFCVLFDISSSAVTANTGLTFTVVAARSELLGVSAATFIETNLK